MNWGKSIVIVYVLFVFGIGYMVYRSTQENFEMVDSNYYQKELEYSDKMVAKNHADALKRVPKVEHDEKSVYLNIPVAINKVISGEVYAYCPSASKNDRKIAIKKNASLDTIVYMPLNILNKANYQLKISWKEGSESFYSEISFDR